MEYSSDMDRRLTEAEQFSAALAGVEREIISAFAAHFNGKPGQYVPKTRLVHYTGWSREEEVGETVTNAIEFIHDYDAILSVFHNVLKGSATIEDYRQTLVREYLDRYAQEVAQVRCGIEAPVRYEPPTIPAFVMEASHV